MIKGFMLKYGGFIATAGIVVITVALLWEKNAHANTREKLLMAREDVATLTTQQAQIAADRAKAVEDALRAQAAELDFARQAENALRGELAQATAFVTRTRRDADAEIGRLKRENAQIREWAATRIPDGWIDFMREPAEKTTTTARAGGSRGDPLPQPTG